MQQAAKLQSTGRTRISTLPDVFEKSDAVRASVYLFIASDTCPSKEILLDGKKDVSREMHPLICASMILKLRFCHGMHLSIETVAPSRLQD